MRKVLGLIKHRLSDDDQGDSVVNNSENEEGDDGDRHCWDSWQNNALIRKTCRGKKRTTIASDNLVEPL